MISAKLLKAALGLALTASLAALGLAPSTAATTQTMHILVMGDSYSSGVGAGSYVSDGTSCYRSSKNYGEQFAALLRAKPYSQSVHVTTAACSGAVTSNVTGSQLSAVHSHDTVVFLTTGGNDAGFASIIGSCLINSLGITRNASYCNAALFAAEYKVGDASTGITSSIGQSQLKALLAIHAKAPAAKVVLIGYPQLEGDTSYSFTTSYYTAQAGQRLNALQLNADSLEQKVVDAANAQTKSSSFAFISTRSTFAGPPFHGLYAQKANPDRWLVAPNASIAQVNWYHPNVTGYAQIAKLLLSSAQVPKAANPAAK